MHPALTPCGLKRWWAFAALACVAAGSAWQAQAQTQTQAGKMKPGLWEITARMQGDGGQMDAGIAMAQQQLKSLPPEQRRQVEAMMKGQGMALGAQGNIVRVCVSKEQAERQELPQAREGCTQEGQRSGKVWRYKFNCTNPPAMSGEGEYTLHSATSASGRTLIHTVVGGRAETMTVDNTSTWLGADCGDLKPRPH
jgi:hypothetical protein